MTSPISPSSDVPDADSCFPDPGALVTVRSAALDGADAVVVAELVRAYLVQTESEKREHGEAASARPDGALPERYATEIADPAGAYAGCTTLLAHIGGRAAGVVIVGVNDAGFEIKRLWTDPRARGRGVGAALLDAAIALSTAPMRLTVWEWRTGALRLYESRGFAAVASWDERAALRCMVLPATV